ncbi:uncharacterized protein LOC132556726 [Ylistrum balloti]|uniref:uncharacterized protein LOC132556726 n=1 Tax=Ylistrum balloti TaxID=509963 RepID=UPI0029058D1E|nr:uncharacterized protein LOC132556726 [Ylistrum balloti]
MTSKSVVWAQIPVRVKGSSICAHHHDTEVTLACRQCSELACVRCIASVHSGHLLDNIADVITTKKGNIQSFIRRTEHQDIVNLKTEIGSITQKIEQNERRFNFHQKELEIQGNRMKDEINIIVTKIVSECTELKRENESRLKKYKVDMEKRIKELTILVQKCQVALETESDVEIFDAEKELYPLPNPELNLCSLAFTPNMHPQGYLDLAMGKRIVAGYSMTYASIHEDNENDSSTGTLAQLKEVTQRNAPFNVSAISAKRENGAWICSNEVSSIYEINDQHRIKKSCFKVCINDISVSPVTGNVWACSGGNNAIMELQADDSSIQRFTTSSTPRCLCVTQDSNIVVGMACKLVCCDVQGNVLLCKNVRTATKVAACPNTRRIAVVELDFREHDGEGRPHILVLDRKFQEQYRYYNNKEDKGTNPESASTAFHPSDVAFDSTGNLLFADYENKSILIMNSTGDVKSIYSDPWHVVALSINGIEEVWAVFRYRNYPNYRIKMLKPELYT